jgi:hypothetical protein
MYIGFLPYVKGKYHKKHQKLTPSRYPKFAFFWLRSTVASQPIILIKKKMVLSSLLPPSHVRKMGLPETIFQHHSLMTEKLIAIFLHFLTKQTNNHFNHTHKIQLLEQSKKKKKTQNKKNQNPCLPNKAIRVQIHWRRTTQSCSFVARSCSLVEPHHVVQKSLSENRLCLIENRVSSVNPPEIRSLFRRQWPNGDPPEI